MKHRALTLTDRPTPETDAMIEENGLACKCAEKPKELCRRLEQQRDAAVDACESVTNQDAEHLARDMDHRCKDHSRWYANVEKARATLAAIKETK